MHDANGSKRSKPSPLFKVAFPPGVSSAQPRALARVIGLYRGLGDWTHRVRAAIGWQAAKRRLVGDPLRLGPAPFAALFGASDTELARQDIVRRTADRSPGFPCRVSLEDARKGEELLLLPWRHHAVDSPYQASGPIYVRRGARQCTSLLQPVAARGTGHRADDSDGRLGGRRR